MFELMVIACVGTHICEYISSPISYPSETRCAYNAALVAGQARGRIDDTWSLEYQYTCVPAGSAETEWITINAQPIQRPDAMPIRGLGLIAK